MQKVYIFNGKCVIFKHLRCIFMQNSIFGVLVDFCKAVWVMLRTSHSRNRLTINRRPQRGAGVTGRTEPNRGCATLKNFFRQNSKVGLRGRGRNSVEGSCSREMCS